MVVYFALDETNNRIKIGYTRGDVAYRRVGVVATEHKVKLKILGVVDGRRNEERDLHKKFKHLCISGEWFKAEEELLSYISQYARPDVSPREESYKRRLRREQTAVSDYLMRFMGPSEESFIIIQQLAEKYHLSPTKLFDLAVQRLAADFEKLEKHKQQKENSR